LVAGSGFGLAVVRDGVCFSCTSVSRQKTNSRGMRAAVLRSTAENIGAKGVQRK
jgi:hypothetical protein